MSPLEISTMRSDLTSLHLKIYIIEDFNMNPKFSHQIDPNPKYITYGITIVSFASVFISPTQFKEKHLRPFTFK